MSTASSELLLPGQPLPAKYTKAPAPLLGAGCYEEGGKVFSSVIGRPVMTGAHLCVVGKQEAGAIPDIGALVTGQIVNGRPVAESNEELTGVVRVADIRLTERDKVKMGECFRLGDIVKARVLSLGDARSYYLSTAANELGVVYATSEDGNPLLPVSYQEMEDSQTGKTERRKVAKPEGV